MPALRRYLRVSKYTVLECRIHLANPSDIAWLTSPQTRALTRVFESIKPVVLSKLQDARDGRKKDAATHEVVVEGIRARLIRAAQADDAATLADYEVSVFLTDSGTPHTVLMKTKTLVPVEPIKSNKHKLWAEASSGPVLIREESVTPPEGIPQDVPTAEPEPAQQNFPEDTTGNDAAEGNSPLFVPGNDDSDNDDDDDDDDDDDSFIPEQRRPKRRRISSREPIEVSSEDELFDAPADEDKKKMRFHMEYDGFGIYERVLRLVVKRKDRKGKGKATNPAEEGNMDTLENWIQMSQAARDGEVEE